MVLFLATILCKYFIHWVKIWLTFTFCYFRLKEERPYFICKGVYYMDQQTSKSILKVVKMTLFIAGILLFCVLAVKASVYLIPFILAFAISTLIEPIIRFLMKKVRMPRKFASAVTILFVLSTFGLIISLIISKLITELTSISRVFPRYVSDFYDNINRLLEKGNSVFSALPVEITTNIQAIIQDLLKSLSNSIGTFAKALVNTAVSLPEALIFTLVTILSTYFFASDRDRIYEYFKSHLPDSWTNRLLSIKDDLFSALFGYLRAQLILMTLTFTELFIGFSIIGVKYALVLAVTISIIDALPILGTGGVLIPWSIYQLLLGDFRLGISLFILYAIVLVVRQMTEPKVLSQQIGLHPLVTLTAMYTGLKLFGVLGLILGPITVLILKNILSGVFKSGMIKEFLNKIKPPMDR